MADLVSLVTDLAQRFDRLDLRFAIGGALATNYWGVVRTTQDVDCLVAIPALKYEALAQELQQMGCELHGTNGKLLPATAAQLRVQANDAKFIECFCDAVRIEFFVPVVPLQDEILRRAIKLPLGNRTVPITTAEDMILLKMAFHRAKDIQDVRGILWVQRGKLDLNYIHNWSAQAHDLVTEQELRSLIEESQLSPET
ncbi:MAG TPA: hypothetical protein VGJ15_02780 [Pirellulales bacterium]|jgi:predicted nucleotidyltransferase